jgi:hypothetical protein
MGIAMVMVVTSCVILSRPPAKDAFVGFTVEQIVERLGEPDSQFEGHYGLPNFAWARQFEPCETFTYEKWNGTLYLSVHEEEGKRVCFSSDWLPKGGRF